MPYKPLSPLSSKKSPLPRSVLGRGLENLFPQGEKHKPLSHTLLWLGIEQIQPNPHQPRRHFDKESLKELADSIRQNGMIQPIVVKKSGEKYDIVAGERRWRAAGLVGQHKVPVWLREIPKSHESILALAENLHRQNLNPIELATAYKIILEKQKWTQEELAHRLSLPRTSLANYLRLLQLHKKVQTWLQSGELSMAHAKLLLSQKEPAHQVRWAQHFISHNISVKMAAQLLNASGKKSQTPSHKTTYALWQKQAIQKLQESHGIKSSLRFKKKGGELCLRYYSNDQLQAILDLLL